MAKEGLEKKKNNNKKLSFLLSFYLVHFKLCLYIGPFHSLEKLLDLYAKKFSNMSISSCIQAVFFTIVKQNLVNVHHGVVTGPFPDSWTAIP